MTVFLDYFSQEYQLKTLHLFQYLIKFLGMTKLDFIILIFIINKYFLLFLINKRVLLLYIINNDKYYLIVYLIDFNRFS